MRTIIFAILFSVLTVVPVHALTGEEWLADCERGYYYLGECSMVLEWNKYYKDVKDCVEICGWGMNEDNFNSYMKTCIPQGVTHEQMIRVSMKWLNEHPEQLHEYMYHLYGKILLETFPCTENNTP